MLRAAHQPTCASRARAIASAIAAAIATAPGARSASNTAIAPACANASSCSTPGNIGLPGKCPGRNNSSPRTRYRAVTDVPCSSASTASTKRNGGRCGRSATSLSDWAVTLREATGASRRSSSTLMESEARSRSVHAPVQPPRTWERRRNARAQP